MAAIVGETKNRTSKASVPVISALRKILDQHRLLCGNPDAGIMFRTKNDTPVRLNNLLNLQILPALERCQHCGRQEASHGSEGPRVRQGGSKAFMARLACLPPRARNQPSRPGRRRYDDPANSAPQPTQRCYIKTLPQQSLTAMNKLDELVERSERVCSERAGNDEPSETIRQVIQ